MDQNICASCHSLISLQSSVCPGCGQSIVSAGNQKNIIDKFEPDCLIHRYEGSDMLEPAVLIKEGKTNVKAATKLKEYAHPVTVPKTKVYQFDTAVLDAIQSLRSDRSATIHRYDELIQSHWQQLKPYQKTE